MLKINFFLLLTFFLFSSCNNNQENKSDWVDTISMENNKLGKALNLGSIAIYFKNEEIVSRPVAEYLVANLEPLGFTHAQSVIARTFEDLADKINKSEVDLTYASLYPTINLDRKTKMQPVLKIYQGGQDVYYSIIFASKKSGIKTLDDLKGRVIVFENNFSTSGYFYPKAMLAKAGYELVECSSPTIKVDKDKIGYCFSENDENTIAWVINDFAEVGATDSDGLFHFSGARKDELVTIYESKPLMRNIISIREDLDKATRKALIDALKQMPTTPKGKEASKNFFDVTKIEEIDSILYLEQKADFEKFIFN